MSSSATSGARGARRVEHLVAAPDLRRRPRCPPRARAGRERAAHHRLVLGEQDADHARPPSGTRHPQPEAAVRARRRASTAADRAARARAARPGRCRRRRRRPRRAPSSTISSAAVAARLDADLAWRAPLWRIDVRRALAHRPGQHRLGVGRQRRRRRRRAAPRSRRPRARCARPPSSLRQRRVPVAADRLAHLRQRAARDRLESAISRGRLVRASRQQPPGQLRLERDHRQAVAEQVVQVAREAQALLGDGQLGELGARRRAARCCADEPAERDEQGRRYPPSWP